MEVSQNTISHNNVIKSTFLEICLFINLRLLSLSEKQEKYPLLEYQGADPSDSLVGFAPLDVVSAHIPPLTE